MLQLSAMIFGDSEESHPCTSALSTWPLANQALRDTFQQCSIAWQAIPHWDTGDPGQINVTTALSVRRRGLSCPPVSPAGRVPADVAEAISPTPDALLTGVMAATETLAQTVDKDVLQKCFAGAPVRNYSASASPADAQELQNALITARVDVENAGYRAPSCLITNTSGAQRSQPVGQRLLQHPSADAARCGDHQLALPIRRRSTTSANAST